MNSYSYKVLVVDNDDTKVGFRLSTGKILETHIIKTVDDALAKLGVTVEHLNKSVAEYQPELGHDYDIVLLDFEMNENQLTEGKGFSSYEYPMGAVTLQPLYLCAFSNSGKIGSCIVQPYSKVMWDRCPKAAAVTHIVHNLLSNRPLRLVHDGVVGSVDINGLVKARAESIVSALSFSAISELKLLLTRDDRRRMLTANLPNVAQELNVPLVNLENLRPDCEDILQLKEWLETLLKGRGYSYEAYEGWKNSCVNALAHAGPRRDYSPLEPWKWIRAKDNAITISNPPGKYNVCPELAHDLMNFDRSAFKDAAKCSQLLHHMFRMNLNEPHDPNLGYHVSTALQSIGDRRHEMMFVPVFTEATKQHGGYVYVHSKCLQQLLAGLRMMVAGEFGKNSKGGVPSLYIHVNSKFKCAYFCVSQERAINSVDVANIQAALKVKAKWNDLGHLLDSWGGLELWAQNCWSVSKHHIKEINEIDSTYTEVHGLGVGKSAVAVVLPWISSGIL